MSSAIEVIFNENDRLIEDLKILSRNGKDNNYAYEYFDGIKNEILIERETIKLAVDTYYLNLCEEIEMLQKKCMDKDTASILESTQTTVQTYEREIVRIKRGLSDFAAGFELRESCHREAKYQNRKLEKDLNIYKTQLLSGIHCHFYSKDVVPLIKQAKLWINHEKVIPVIVS